MHVLTPSAIALVLCSVSPAAWAGQPPRHGLEEVPHQQVELRGGFWGPRLSTCREVTVPHALDCLENDGHVTNFDKAAGLLKGPPSGHAAFDSDLYKVLEGACDALQHGDEPALHQRVDGILSHILAAQQKDGFLISYFIIQDQAERWNDLRLMHQMYNAGHMFEMAVAHAKLTGQTNVLDAARRFADHIDGIFGPGKRYDVDGHQEVELALVKLYRATGEKRYLDLARFFLDERGYAHGTERKPFDGSPAPAPRAKGPLTPEQQAREQRRARMRVRDGKMQDHKPVVEQHEAVGHAVRAGYMYAAMTDMARFMDAPDYQRAVDSLWNDVVGRKMYLTGGIGSNQYEDEGFGDPYLLPNETYCESCAAIAHVLWQHRMNLLAGQAKYADVMELTLYNGLLSGISLSGDRFFYQNPLINTTGRQRNPWIGLSCCPTNLTRILPQVGGLAYARGKGELFVNLYMAGEATLQLDDGPTVKLTQQTEYPWDGHVRLVVAPAQAAEFALCLRIPGWALGRPVPSDLYRFAETKTLPVGLKVNGQPSDATPATDGYVHLKRRWQAGDVVELDLPMPVQRVYAHAKVQADEGKVALMRGPIVYCVEQADNLCLDLFRLALPREAELQAEHCPGMLGGVTIIRGAARYGDYPVTLTAVPYYAWANRENGPMEVWIDESPAGTGAGVGRLAAHGEPEGAKHTAAPDTVTMLDAPIVKPVATESKRRAVSLDGTWDIAEGPMETAPTWFDHTVPVPGLVDMARPAFAEVGTKSKLREAFWYRRTFRVDGPLPGAAVLKVHKAMFGTRVILNGTTLGDHMPCFTPGLFEAAKALRVGENEIVVRVGACRECVPRPMPSGWDYEKRKFIPGIFDTVELILTGTPHIARVQAVPDIEKQAVTVHAWVQRAGDAAAAKLHFTVREARSTAVVGEGECDMAAAGSSTEQTGQATIRIRNCRLWSPEDPFLYELETSSEADSFNTRFGMRTFRLDPATGRAMLNGRPYFMRGSNVTLYRFFEDAERGDKPWRKEWVRRLHQTFRDMHWNSLRYCIGFPPEAWYRIADEEGFMIQDEFPIWNMERNPAFDGTELAGEFTEWLQERWNHPCVVVWDACNETRSPATGKAIQKVRGLDFSHRPWDNGWSAPMAAGDSSGQHPYHFYKANFKLSQVANDPGTLGWKPGKSPIIVNEYGWLWLNRDGTPTTLTSKLYGNLLGKDSTTAQRRHLYARYLAAETEFWRSHRACAAVLHFCALGYSRPDGQTSDHWQDLERLAWEPEFRQYVGDAFAPVGLMIDAWGDQYQGGATLKLPVAVINDLDQQWQGPVTLRVTLDGRSIIETSRATTVAALGRTVLAFEVLLPAGPGQCQAIAELSGADGRPVRSLRDFRLVAPPGAAK